MLALGRAEVVAGGIGPWVVVVVGVLVGHGDGVVEGEVLLRLGFSVPVGSRQVLSLEMVYRLVGGIESFGFLECVCLVRWLKRRAGRLPRAHVCATHTSESG